jgi:Na+:H+ antiporter, NhaA family
LTQRRRARRHSPLGEFLRTDAAGGIVLLVATVIGLWLANSGWTDEYGHVLHHHIAVGFGRYQLDMSVLHWINDGLMVIFFFVVGLEIKREIAVGELRNPRTAALPLLAALMGMVVPAAIFVAVVRSGEGLQGWGIPMATDIAFAVGILALLGSRVPASLKMFLLTLAIADDVGAIIIIAVFYSGPPAWWWLAGTVVAVGVMLLMRLVGFKNPLWARRAPCGSRRPNRSSTSCTPGAPSWSSRSSPSRTRACT